RAEQKELEVVAHVLPDVPNVAVGDPGRLRQVLVNLLGNAIKFTERGQILWQVEVAGQQADRTVLHHVGRDSRIGNAPDKAQAIFEPFKQADGSTTRRFGGTGLGLAISSTLVELMGGRVWVDSALHEGSTFHFTVRLGKSDARPEVPAVNLTDLPVLIVDDNAVNRRVLHDLLLRWKMPPTVVNSGSRALRALEEAHGNSQPFRLVLVDANMPEMDGLEVARRIRDEARLGGATIMMLSSSGQYGESNKAREVGIAACLTKPVDQRELLAAIGRVLARENGQRAPLPAAMLPATPPARRGQPGEPAARREPARAAGPQGHHREQRARSGRRGAAADLRHRAHGRADAGDGRLRGNRGDPRDGAGSRQSSADRRDDRARDEGRSRALPRGRHGRIPHQAARSPPALLARRADRRRPPIDGGRRPADARRAGTGAGARRRRPSAAR